MYQVGKGLQIVELNLMISLPSNYSSILLLKQSQNIVHNRTDLVFLQDCSGFSLNCCIHKWMVKLTHF